MLDALLKAAAPGGKVSRIVNVSSIAESLFSGKTLNFNLQADGGKAYTAFGAYATSKLCNLLFTRELNKRLALKKLPIIAVACHPGYSATNLQHR